jgi:predicted DNA-binding transcriptional regulator AlpA
MPKRVNLTDAQVAEMLSAYENNSMSAVELSTMYGISDSTFYRILAAHGGSVQFPDRQPRSSRGKNGKVTIRKIDPAKMDMEEIEEPEANVVHTAPLAVVVDKHSMVQTVKPTHRALSTWEVKYTGTLLVQADDIEEAIREARKVGVVKRIYSARLKGE